MAETAETKRLSITDIPALDGLRAIAVLLVMLLHFDWLGCGWIGVQFFYVLSGFLISANLFVAKGQLGRRDLILSFYAKRFLRIFPLYYLALGMYFVFEASPLFSRIFPPTVASGPNGYLAHALFLQNFSDDLFHSSGTIRVLGHFWSLAVEEQFYLVFPFLLAFLSRKYLKTLAWAVILLVPLWRSWMDSVAVYKNTLGQIDAFAIGVLLSMGWVTNPAFRDTCERYRKRVVLGIATYGAMLILAGGLMLHTYKARGVPIGNTTLGYEPRTDFYSHVWVFTAMDLLGGLLVLYCLLWNRNRLLSHPALRYLGRISFGLYVYHYPIAFAFEENFHIRFKSAVGVVFFAGYFMATLTVASLSYYLWEKRFLRMKSRFTEHFLAPRAAPATS